MGFVPSGAVQEQDAVFVWELRCRMCKEEAHQLGINPGQDHGCHLSVQWAHGHIGIYVFANDLAADGGAQWQGSPAASSITDPSEAAFILEQKATGCAKRKPLGYGFDDFREFF